MIEYFRLEIKPWQYDYPNPREKVLEIRMDVNGEKHHTREIVIPDDLESVYDLMIDRAKVELKKVIAEHQAVSDQQE